MSPLECILVAVGVSLQILVFSAFLRGPFRTLPLLFAYVTVVLAGTCLQSVALVVNGRNAYSYARYYWLLDLIQNALLLSALLRMLDRAYRNSTGWTDHRRTLLAITVYAGALASLFAHLSPRLNQWMTLLSRDLSFGATLLNMALWLALLKTRSDHRILSLTSALGIQMTGAAIGHSFRYLSAATVSLGNVILVASHLLCFYLMWRALRCWNAAPASRPAIPIELPAGAQSSAPI